VRPARAGLGFEWLGFDVMVAEDRRAAATAALRAQAARRPHAAAAAGAAGADAGSTLAGSAPAGVGPLCAFLIEANTSPDVSHSTATTAALVPPATADLLALLLDEGHARDPVPTTATVAGPVPTATAAAAATPGAAVAIAASYNANAKDDAFQHNGCLRLSAPLLPRRLCPLFPYAGPLADATAAATDATATEEEPVWTAAPGFPTRPCWQLWYLGDGDELNEGADPADCEAATAAAEAAAACTTAAGATTTAARAGVAAANCRGGALALQPQPPGVVEPATLVALVRAVPELAGVRKGAKIAHLPDIASVAVEVDAVPLRAEMPALNSEAKPCFDSSDDEL
jgi:hypothetical protein